MKLRVIHSFGPYKTGQEISDAATIKEILSGEQDGFVVKVNEGQAPKAPPTDVTVNDSKAAK